jgi:Lysophospholipase
MKTEHFEYLSNDKLTKIHGIRWIPEGEIKGILQISHGMAEYVNRYDEFASYLAQKGILVTGNDHLGHGKSITHKENEGFFSEKNGNENVIEDIRGLQDLTKREYPNLPYYILGHSMGSHLLRQYICIYGNTIEGAIYSGAGNMFNVGIKLSMTVIKGIAKVKGWNYSSEGVDKLAIGGFNKKIKNARTSKDWLSRNEKNVDEYIKDEKCGFSFTVNAYYNMLKGMDFAFNRKNIKKIPKDLPILMIAGDKDPVGHHGKDILAIAKQYKKMGIRQVEYVLYKDDRHEILNETDRDKVYRDIYVWLGHQISSIILK